MTESLFSPSWYRVTALKPRLRGHARVHRHRYRGQAWYVLQDNSNARYHRFTPAAYFIIGLLDGQRTVNEIWDAANAELGDDAPTQDEVIQLLGQLHGCDVLQCDVPPDTMELFRRYERGRLEKIKQSLMRPMAPRIPLLDPERFLNWCLPVIRPLFGWGGLLVWFMVVATGFVLAISHWPDLTENLVDRVLTRHNLVLLWLAFPVIKALHELAHAFATRVWGGEVHEMGITLLVLIPVPYVDASAASAFADKRKRILVGAAGMMVELFIAALALVVWLNVEQGAVRQLMYDIMLIGGVSTLFFNGNPLLRFDSYYMLGDAIEIPNLGARSQKYLGYLIQRYVFGVREAESPVTAAGEPAWFVFYGVAAFAYRMFITAVIVLFVAGKFFVVGVLLAEWAVITMVIIPIGKQIGFLGFSAKLRRTRFRAIGISALATMAVVVLIFYVPAPFWTRVEGVVWLPEHSQVRAGTEGTVRDIIAGPNSPVVRDTPLVGLEDPFLDANVAVLESKLEALTARHHAASRTDRVEAEVIDEEIAGVRAELEHALERAQKLVVRSPAAGNFIVPEPQNLPGRFVRQGELLGYVADESDASIRAVVSQSDILLIRQRTLGVEVKLASRPDRTIPAVIEREVPAANFLLPSKALGTAGGGRIAVDPNNEPGTKALEKVFQVDIALLGDAPDAQFGERVYVRIEHGRAPLGKQWYWMGRQLFLRRFGV